MPVLDLQSTFRGHLCLAADRYVEVVLSQQVLHSCSIQQCAATMSQHEQRVAEICKQLQLRSNKAIEDDL
jgi:hypothetical protein